MKGRHAKKFLKAQTLALSKGDILALAAPAGTIHREGIQRLTESLAKWCGFKVPVVVLPVEQLTILRAGTGSFSVEGQVQS